MCIYNIIIYIYIIWTLGSVPHPRHNIARFSSLPNPEEAPPFHHSLLSSSAEWPAPCASPPAQGDSCGLSMAKTCETPQIDLQRLPSQQFQLNKMNKPHFPTHPSHPAGHPPAVDRPLHSWPPVLPASARPPASSGRSRQGRSARPAGKWCRAGHGARCGHLESSGAMDPTSKASIKCTYPIWYIKCVCIWYIYIYIYYIYIIIIIIIYYCTF